MMVPPREQQSEKQASLKLDEFLRQGNWIDSPPAALQQQQQQPQLLRDYPYVYEILKQYPNLAGETFGGYLGGFLPFHLIEKEKQKKAFPLTYLIAAHAPLDVLEDVYSMHPDDAVLSQKQGENGALPLHVACQHGASFPVVSFLVRQNPHSVYETDFRGNLPLHLLLKRKSFSEDCLKIARLLLDKFPQSILETTCFDITALMYAIKNECIPVHLMQFLVSRLPHDFHEILLDETNLSSQKVVQNLLSLQHKLYENDPKNCSLIFQTSNLLPQALNTLFPGIQVPLSIRMDRCEIFKFLHEDWYAGCRVKRLEINQCAMKEKCYRSMLDKILQLNHHLQTLILNTVKVEHHNVVDITDFVAAILRRQSALTYLSCFQSGSLDTALITDILKSGENMTTYVKYRQEEGGKPDRQIMYYSFLNRHGRSNARDPNGSKSLLVEHLIGLQNDTTITGLDQEERHIKDVALYGLLREAPGLWVGL